MHEKPRPRGERRGVDVLRRSRDVSGITGGEVHHRLAAGQRALEGLGARGIAEPMRDPEVRRTADAARGADHRHDVRPTGVRRPLEQPGADEPAGAQDRYAAAHRRRVQ